MSTKNNVSKPSSRASSFASSTMSAQSSRKSSISIPSRKASRTSSISTVDSRDSDRDSHASLDATAWATALAIVNSPEGRESQTPVTDSEDVRVSVNNAGKVRAKRTTYEAQRNQISPGDLKGLTDKAPAVCGLLRLRHHASQPLTNSDIAKQELHIYLDGSTSLKRVYKKDSLGRNALAKNLALRPRKGDRYTLRSHLEGRNFDSGLYAAADDDLRLEEAVHNVSKTAFNAEAGVMRMPLKKASQAFTQSRPVPQDLKQVFDLTGYGSHMGGRHYHVTSRTKSGLHNIEESSLKRDQFQKVTQETYIAGSRRFPINPNRPRDPGNFETRHESLAPTPTGDYLEHEKLRINSKHV